MYKISVPIRNHTVTPENRATYLDLLKRSGAERVFLTRSRLCESEEEEQRMIDSLRANVSYFAENGLEVGIWVGSTIGHGVPLVGVDPQENAEITPLQN